MENTPNYLLLDRRTVAMLTALTKVLSRLSAFSISGSLLTGVSTLLAGTKIDLILPILIGATGFLAQTVNEVIYYLLSVAEVQNPLPSRSPDLT